MGVVEVTPVCDRHHRKAEQRNLKIVAFFEDLTTATPPRLTGLPWRHPGGWPASPETRDGWNPGCPESGCAISPKRAESAASGIPPT